MKFNTPIGLRLYADEISKIFKYNMHDVDKFYGAHYILQTMGSLVSKMVLRTWKWNVSDRNNDYKGYQERGEV